MKTWLVLLLMLSFAPWSYATPPACSAWAAPQGSGSACSASQPCKVGTWLGNQAGPGQVLCLKSGEYRGDDSMLQFSARSGTAGNPLVVRAEEDGEVLINGQHERRPLDCNASHITVQGVDVANGVDTTAVVRGQHCLIQRVVAYTQEPEDGGTENVWDLGGAHNTLEDIAGWGFSRKILAAGARGGDGPNTVTRAWVEQNGSPKGSAQGEPAESAEIGYNQSNVLFQNVIARRNILSSTAEPEAAHHIFSTHNSSLLGSISYVLSTDNYDTDIMLNATPEAGSHAGSGFVTSGVTIQDVLLIADPAHSTMRGLVIDGGLGSTGNTAKNIISVAADPGRCHGDGWTCTNLYLGQTLAQALGNKKIWEVAPGLCYEVVNRQVTNTPLWPWKMQSRIQAALASARMPAKNVTEHATRAMGEIPPQCLRSGETPPGPGVPVPPTGVTAQATAQGVQVSWVDTQTTAVTGYTVERKVGTGSYAELSAAPGPDARTYLDRTPVAGAQNCYVVYTRAVAGPSGFSAEACVQVPGTPGPGPGATPLACVGVLGDGARVAIACQPAP